MTMSPPPSNGNGGITKPITETVRALAGTPMLLVLVVMNILILGMITYLLKVRSETMSAERTEMVELLRNCLSKLHENDHAGLLGRSGDVQ